MIGVLQDLRLTLRVGDDLGLGVPDLELDQLTLAEDLVDLTGPLPEHQLPPRLSLHVGPEVAIGGEDDGLIFREQVHDVHGVARRADHVGERLHRGGAVDVAHHLVAGVGVDEGLELVRRAVVGEGAAGLQIGQHHDLVGVHDLRRLRHEVHAGEDDDLGVGLRGFLAQAQAVPHVVGDVLDVALLVVVGQDDGLALVLEPLDLLKEVEVGIDGRVRRVHVDLLQKATAPRARRPAGAVAQRCSKAAGGLSTACILAPAGSRIKRLRQRSAPPDHHGSGP